MQHNVWSPICGGRRWRILIYFFRDILAEIPRIKMLSFWQQLDKRKTEWRPKNGEHAFLPTGDS
jgi:hypothetical protein